jgi:hypothetical protein
VSAAVCIGAPLTKIRYVRGWSKTNDVVTGKHIDPTVSEKAWLLFG